MIAPEFFARDPVACARDLIGARLVHRDCSGVVIETEAYHEVGDEACHLFSRPSARRFAEANPPGTAYVYLNYGVHWLANVLCRDEATGHAGFVLFRALEPRDGVAAMRRRRSTERLGALCSGPGKLTQALGVDGSHHERNLAADPEFHLLPCETRPDLVSDRRIGISRARELPWRFLVRDHDGVSVRAGRA